MSYQQGILVTICFTGCAPSRILAERKKRKKKNINPFYSFVTFTFCLSDWSFCDSNCPLQMSRTGLWFSISLKFSVLFDLNLRNLFVEFRLAQLLFWTLGHWESLSIKCCRISEHLSVFCPDCFCLVRIPSLTKQMFVHAVRNLCCSILWPPDAGLFFLMYILTNQFHTSFTASSSTVIHT